MLPIEVVHVFLLKVSFVYQSLSFDLVKYFDISLPSSPSFSPPSCNTRDGLATCCWATGFKTLASVGLSIGIPLAFTGYATPILSFINSITRRCGSLFGLRDPFCFFIKILKLVYISRMKELRYVQGTNKHVNDALPLLRGLWTYKTHMARIMSKILVGYN